MVQVSPRPHLWLATGIRYTPRTYHQHVRSVHKTRPEPFKILYFGRDDFSCTIFKELHSAKDVWQYLAIVTHPDAWIGRRNSVLSISPLKKLGEELNAPVHTMPSEISEFKKWPTPAPFDEEPLPHHLAVTASFGRILPLRLLRQFPPDRRLNVHPSLLPRYRGPAPIQQALLGGEKETGVGIIEMKQRSAGIDVGDIYAQTTVPIPPESSFHTLRATLAQTGATLLVSTLRAILTGDPPAPQPQAPVLPDTPYAPFIRSSDVHVSFTHSTAAALVLRHRAIGHHKPLTARLRTTPLDAGKTVQLHAPAEFDASRMPPGLPVECGAAVFHPPSRAVLVRCAEGTVLSVPQLKTQDKNLLGAKDWWNGIPAVWREESNTVRFVEWQ